MKENYEFPTALTEIIEIAKNVITHLGIQNFKIQPSSHKCRIFFSIINQGQSTDECWSTFPVLIDIEAFFVKIYIVFTYKGKAYSFSDENLKIILMDYITMVNPLLSIGMLKFSSAKQYARFENCFCYSFLPQKAWQSTFHNYIANALSSYKAFGFGFVRIVDRTESNEIRDLSYLLEICSSRFTGRAPLTKQQLAANVKKYRDSILGVEEGCVEVPPETFNKLKNLEVFQYFDEENLEAKAGKFIYNYFALQNIVAACENLYEFPEGLCSQISEVIFLFYQRNLIFSAFPLDLLKVRISNEKISAFCFSFKNFESFLSAAPISLSNYKLLIWQGLSQLSLQYYSTQLHRSIHLSPIYKISLNSFSEPKLENKALLIGNGGFGTIYSNTYCGSQVALKFPSQRKEDLLTANERIKREYLITRSLPHPNILPVYGYVNYKGKLGYVMKFFSQGTLNEAIKEAHFFTRTEKVTILLQVSMGLTYLHSHNFVHLDIKPHNIFLSNNVPIIGDFGLSASLNNEKNSAMKLGCTVYYSPPEQIKSSPPQKSSDVWAFGMTMYQFFTGKHPFGFLRESGKIEKEQFYVLLTEKHLRPKISDEFEENNSTESKIMRKCWKMNPAKRPSMGEITEKLLILKEKLDRGLEI